jgi:hypothetical protein
MLSSLSHVKLPPFGSNQTVYLFIFNPVCQISFLYLPFRYPYPWKFCPGLLKNLFIQVIFPRQFYSLPWCQFLSLDRSFSSQNASADFHTWISGWQASISTTQMFHKHLWFIIFKTALSLVPPAFVHLVSQPKILRSI